MGSVERVYQELANCYEYQGQAQMRDRFLILAADALLSAGRTEEVERVRARLLEQNPHHLIKPYSTFGEALGAPDVRNYVEGLRRMYPPESAAQLLESLRTGGPDKTPPIPEGVLNVLWPVQDPPPKPKEGVQFYRLEYPVEAAKPSPKPSMHHPGDTIPMASPFPPVATPKVSGPSPASSAQAGKPVPPGGSPLVSPVGPGQPSSSGTLLAGEEYQYPAEAESTRRPPGAWVCTGLFLVTLIAGMALAIYSLVKPLLTP